MWLAIKTKAQSPTNRDHGRFEGLCGWEASAFVSVNATYNPSDHNWYQAGPQSGEGSCHIRKKGKQQRSWVNILVALLFPT